MLPARNRLKNNRTFNYIYRKGKSVGGAYSVLLYTEARGRLLIGFSVSKKIGGSVTRNLVKRRLRESVREIIPNLKDGYHVVIVAREAILGAEFLKLKSAIKLQFERAGLLKEKSDEIPLH